MKIQVQLLNDNASLPIYATAGAAGCDIFASEDFTINPTQVKAEVSPQVENELKHSLFTTLSDLLSSPEHTNPKRVAKDLTTALKTFIEETTYNFQLGQKTVNTGVAFGIPINSNIELELRSKSGLAFKKTVHAFNGTLDEDYTQELKLLIFNLASEPIHFKKGEKVAQGVFKQIIQADFELVTEFNRDEYSNYERENNPSVRKDIRTGGFGHTGTTIEGTNKL